MRPPQKFVEGDLEITFPGHLKVRKFDDHNHGMSHCLSAVDFILNDGKAGEIFIEVKDPSHPKAEGQGRKWIESLGQNPLTEKLTRKFHDSFLYRWAEGDFTGGVCYYVLIAVDTLQAPALLTLGDSLARMLPSGGAPSWRQRLARHCNVFNLDQWNKQLGPLGFSAMRLGQQGKPQPR